MDILNEYKGAFYQNCKFHDPRGRGFSIRVGPKWSLMKCVTIEHFELLDNYHSNSFQIWDEASLGQGAHQL